jgi:SHS2 domain-containing protein
MKEKKVEGYQAVPHTADWAIRVWSLDFGGLCIQAAKGMYSLLRITEADSVPVQRYFGFQSVDSESMLVDFLNELLFILDSENLAAREITIRITGSRLEADLICVKIEQLQKEIKAATFSALKIKRGKGGYSTTVVFDV